MAKRKYKKQAIHIERICSNCRLYNCGFCSVVILHEGERLKLPMDPEESCFFEGDYFDPTTKAMENFSEDIQQVKFWVENEDGEKTSGNGIVKIEYPEGFFSPFSLEKGEKEDIFNTEEPNN